MADDSNPLHDHGIGLERLAGQVNYRRWARDFRRLLECKGAAGALKTPKLDWRREQSYYTAYSLLQYWVDPVPRMIIDELGSNNFLEIWIHLEKKYRMDDELALKMAEQKLKGLRLKDFSSVTEYSNDYELLKHDLLDAGGSVSTRDTVTSIAAGLTLDFAVFLKQPAINDILSKIDHHVSAPQAAESKRNTQKPNEPVHSTEEPDELLKQFISALLIAEVENKNKHGNNQLKHEVVGTDKIEAADKAGKDVKEDWEMMY